MKNLKKLIEYTKTKEVKDLFRESVRSQTKELYNGVLGVLLVGASVFSLYAGLSYIDSIGKNGTDTNSGFSSLNKEGECIKYVPRTGYFYFNTNKKVE